MLMLILVSSCTSQSPSTPVDRNSDESIADNPAIVRLLADLRHRGIMPEEVGTSQVWWLSSAPGLGYQLGPDRSQELLYIHLYPDVEAAARVAAQIPPSADRGNTDWVDDPHFFQCDNLITLYLGKDSKVTSAFTDLCGPQFAGKKDV